MPVADTVILKLQADIAAYMAQTARAQSEWDRRLGAMERRAQRAERTMARSFSRFVSIGALALAGREVAEYADTWTQVGRALESTESLFGVRLRSAEALAEMAKETRSDLLSLTKLYTRTAQSTRDLGLAEEDVATVTTTVAKALKLGSASAAEQTSVLTQLSQALSKGKLDGDEFRSVMENASVVQLALSRHLNKSRGDIIRMAADGKLQVRDLVGALLSIAPEVDRQFGRTVTTIGEAFTNLQTTITTAFAKVDDEFGIVNEITAAVAGLSEAIEQLASMAITLGPAFAQAGSTLDSFFTALRDNGIWFRQTFGIPLTSMQQAVVQSRTGGNMVRPEGPAAGLPGAPRPLPSLPAGPSELSDGEKKVQTAIDKAKEHIAVLREERLTLGQSTYEITRRMTALELMNDATSAGVEITPKLALEIELLALQTANHVAALEQEEYQLQRVNEAAMGAFDAFKQGFSDVILGAESFGDALGGILEKLAQIALDNVFTSLFSPGQIGGLGAGPGGGIFGFLGSLLTGGFAGGGNIPSGKLGIVGEDGPEFAKGPMTVFSNAASRNMAGGVNISVTNVIDARNSDAAAIAGIRASLPAMARSIEAQTVASVRAQIANMPSFARGGR